MSEMKLNDVRRYAISSRNILRYRDGAGREAVLNQKGTIDIPGVTGQPPYNVEEVFAAAVEFQLEPWSSAHGDSEVKVVTKLTREQLAAEVEKHMPASARLSDHHDEE